MVNLRADAVRNRDAILCAAASVFAASGPDASLNDVARAAGVGIATLYRRFPTRDSLFEAVYDAKMTAYADAAERAAEDALSEPWSAFCDHVAALVEDQVADPAFGTVLLSPLQGSDIFASEHERAFTATKLLVRRTRASGVARDDLHHSDLYVLLASSAALVTQPGPLEPHKAARRLATLFLDGVRRERS